ncbi:GNAT family N-acetyltransferase [Bacillus horti]|uniref:Acetyltransferase n=1 Tax=Caldalkalibacillus horti TaxID=77523 RepID=A0ABT9W2C0_9BACI|nr:GNAT family N-acetyltransferase [Bacillus horti]MDQ0167397.1 putative acetyltransferase [Bacillus horti]
MRIREIEIRDNTRIKEIIQESLESVGLNIEGTAYYDPHLGELYHFYHRHPHSMYWVIVDKENRVQGGVGIAEFNAAKRICELQKLYLSSEAQGKGYSRLLMDKALHFAEKHYDYCYLETRHELVAASALYVKYGFMLLTEPIEGSEHSAMDAWYLKKLKSHYQNKLTR